MANRTYDQQNQMKGTRKINREVGHYFAEKQGKRSPSVERLAWLLEALELKMEIKEVDK